MNKKISRIFIIMYIFVFSFSCKFIDFSQLEVSCSLGESGDYFFDQELEVVFSMEVELASVKEILILQENNSTVATEVRMAGRAVFIKPVEPWQKGAGYKLQIQGDLSLAAGGTHQVNFYRSFTYGPKVTAFSLTDWISPLEHSSSLDFQFNYPVDSASFSRNFSLTPSVDYTYELEEEGRRVKIVPLEGWKYNQRFTWSIQGLEALEGFLLDKKYEGDFLAQIDTELPVLEKICGVHLVEGNGYFPKEGEKISLCDREPLLFQFSKEMDFDSLEAGIHLEPSHEGQLRKGASEKEFLWIPEENWSLEEEYRVVVSSEVQDVAGISLGQQKEAYFTIDSDFLQVTSISLGDSIAEAPDFQVKEPLQAPLQDAFQISVQDSSSTIVTRINFNKKLEAELMVQALDAISMDVLFPLTASYPVLEQVHYLGQSSLDLFWSGFSPSSDQVDNFYRLKIAGGPSGPQTSAGNYLKEDVCIIIHVLQS